MKRIIVALAFLLATTNVASAQQPPRENLRGLPGVRLIVKFGKCPTRDYSNCASGLDEAQRPEVLRMLEADVTAALENAGIPVFGIADERNQKAGGPLLVVMVTVEKPNGFNHPYETEVKLLQRARLVREPSVEFDALTWRRGGVGAPLDIAQMRNQVASLVNSFITDYRAENPKQSASLRKDKSKDSKR